jgi:hypothetical protein
LGSALFDSQEGNFTLSIYLVIIITIQSYYLKEFSKMATWEEIHELEKEAQGHVKFAIAQLDSLKARIEEIRDILEYNGDERAKLGDAKDALISLRKESETFRALAIAGVEDAVESLREARFLETGDEWIQ